MLLHDGVHGVGRVLAQGVEVGRHYLGTVMGSMTSLRLHFASVCYLKVRIIPHFGVKFVALHLVFGQCEVSL